MEEIENTSNISNLANFDNQLPRHIGRYEIVELLGKGGMGKIYKAVDSDLERIVAIKVLNEAEFNQTHHPLLKEARIAAQLSHPNIVTIYEKSQESDQHYIVMEYIPGCSLTEYLKQGLPNTQWVMSTFYKIVLAIQYAHHMDVLHRDLKPANIMMMAKKEPKVTDFGLAKMINADTSVSSSGTIIGTPAYIPPEQIHGKVAEIDQRSDVYGLGAILYEMLTGRPPFHGNNLLEIARAVLEKPPQSPKKLNNSVPDEVEAICLKCLEKNPKRRYQTARALAQDIERYLTCRPITLYSHRTFYRMNKWIKRNLTSGKVGMAGIFLVCLVSIISNVFMYRYTHEKPVQIIQSQNLAKSKSTQSERILNHITDASTEHSKITMPKSERYSSLPDNFWADIKKLVEKDADYATIEAKFLEAQKSISPSNLFHRQWGKCCLFYASGERQQSRRKELLKNALRQFDRALAIFPDDFQTCFLAYQLCIRYLHNEQWYTIAEIYRHRMKDESNQYHCYVQAHDEFDQAQVLQDAKLRNAHLESALRHCDEALRYESEFAYAYAMKAIIYCKLKNYPESLQNCQIALALSTNSMVDPLGLANYTTDFFPHPGHVDFLTICGDVYYESENFHKAIEFYDEAIKSDAGNAKAYTRRGQCYKKSGRFEESCSDLSLAIQAEGNLIVCYRERGESYLALKKYSSALEDAQTLARLYPTESASHILKADIYGQQHQYQKAIDEIQIAIELDPKDSKLYLKRAILGCLKK